MLLRSSCISPTRQKGTLLFSLTLIGLMLIGFLVNYRFFQPSQCASGSEMASAKMAAIAKGKSVLLIVLVVSYPRSYVSRNAIRQTWAHDVPVGIKVLFVVGTKDTQEKEIQGLLRENTMYNDILMLENLTESYSSLTSKLLEMLVWAHENLDFKYLMKVDEDSFVRLNLFPDELSKIPQEKIYWGFFDGNSPILKTGKWAESEYVLCDRYIPYALGGGYVISSDIVKYVASNAKHLKKFQNEDVSLGAWLAPLDIKRVHDPRFDTEFESRGCFNAYIVTHKKSPEEMEILYDNLQKFGNLCAEEFRSRFSFVYDWSDVPTNCCNRVESEVP